MSEFLAIEWEHEHVCGVLAHVTPGRVRIDRTFVIPKPSQSVSSSGPLQVDWLRPQLVKLGITGGQALVALPRDEAVVKRIELPEAPDDELPVLVRFQAGAKSSVALDDLSLDFIPLPRRSDVPGREALMATVPRQTIDEVLTVCRLSGLEPVSIGLTAAAVAEFVARAESSADNAAAGASLVVARHGNRVEISMLRRCHLLFSHSARLSEAATGQEAQAIVAEVSRALVALRGAIADVKIERAWTLVSASEHEQLAESLHRRLQCEVSPLDPFASVERDPRVADAIADRSLFAGPIGMLLAKSDPRVPGLDFLSPRRPPVKRNVRKQQKILAGAAVATLAALLVGYQWMRLASLDSQIDDLKTEENDLTDQLTKGAPAAGAAALVGEWEAEGEDWLEELAELTERMPSTEKVFLRQLKCDPKSGSSPAANMKLEGYARDQSDALGLNPRFLVKGDRYQGLPVTESAETKQEFYSANVKKTIRIVPEKDRTAATGDPAAEKAPSAENAPSAEKGNEPAPGTVKPADQQTSDSPPRASRKGASS
jgi:Tfp pilus assembly PilM family ATPase